MQILEEEVNGRYKAWVIVDGVYYEKIILRNPVVGWPYEYKEKAHLALKAAIIARRHNGEKT